MTLPLLGYLPSTQNARIAGYEVPGDEHPVAISTEVMLSPQEMDGLIWAAYRQVFSEHQMLESNRQPFLESQLRRGQITVRDFIRGLATSDPFRRYNYESNSNYRFVELCVQRLLGRDIYNEREKIAWSIVLATQGVQGFVDALLDSDEYLNTFGSYSIPFQRRRVLPLRPLGETPFNLKTPRYDAYYRDKYTLPGRRLYRWAWQYPPYSKWYRYLVFGVAGVSSVGLVLGLILVFLAFYGLIQL